MNIKKNKDYLMIGISFCFFLLFLFLVIFERTDGLDTLVYNFIISFRNDFFDIFFKSITVLSNPAFIIIFLIVGIILTRNHYSLFLVINVLDVQLLNLLIKHTVKRIRPEDIALITQGGYSFPSGHAMMSFALYGYLCYLAWVNVSNKKIRYTVCAFLAILILLIGTSRVYLGVHYASDVIAGYLLSFAYLVIFISLTKRIGSEYFDKTSSK